MLTCIRVCAGLQLGFQLCCYSGYNCVYKEMINYVSAVSHKHHILNKIQDKTMHVNTLNKQVYKKEAIKYYSVIIHLIIFTCAFPALTSTQTSGLIPPSGSGCY